MGLYLSMPVEQWRSHWSVHASVRVQRIGAGMGVHIRVNGCRGRVVVSRRSGCVGVSACGLAGVRVPCRVFSLRGAVMQAAYCQSGIRVDRRHIYRGLACMGIHRRSVGVNVCVVMRVNHRSVGMCVNV